MSNYNVPEGWMLVPAESIRRAIGALERFANDSLAGRNSAHELRELLAERDQLAEPDEERLAMEAVMESVDPATWPGLTAAQRCSLGRFAKPVKSSSDNLAPVAPAAQVEPAAVAITEKQVMTAYFYASRLHISGTSNWAAAFAQSLNGQIAAPPAQPDARVLSILRDARESVDYRRGMQNLGREDGRRHAAELASLIERIDAVLAGKGGGE